jgi:sugar lactone lactonase YvrE
MGTGTADRRCGTRHLGHLQGRRDINRYAPDGSLPGSLRLPVEPATPWAFGGSHLAALFVTTSREGLDHATRPLKPDAGRLFSNVRPGLRGRRCQPNRGRMPPAVGA